MVSLTMLLAVVMHLDMLTLVDHVQHPFVVMTHSAAITPGTMSAPVKRLLMRTALIAFVDVTTMTSMVIPTAMVIAMTLTTPLILVQLNFVVIQSMKIVMVSFPPIRQMTFVQMRLPLWLMLLKFSFPI